MLRAASRRSPLRFAPGQPSAGYLAPLDSSEENLAWLRERGAHYLVGTPKPKLRDFEQHLTDADWTRASSEVQVKLCPDSEELYVLCRSTGRVEKEHATRDGRRLTLPRITEPEKEQAALLLQLGWTLPEQPPPRIRIAPPPAD